MSYKRGHAHNKDFIFILIQSVSWAMINFPLIMYRMFSKKTVFQSTGISPQKLYVVKFLLECSFVFCLLNGMSNKSSMCKIMVNCDKIIKSYALIQEFLVHNYNEPHRMRKFVVFLCKRIVLKSVNWSSFIGRYVWKIHDKVSESQYQ